MEIPATGYPSRPEGAPSRPEEPIRSAELPRTGEPTRERGRELDLVEALAGVREVVAHTSYPLALPSAEPAREVAAAVLTQLDDYLIPRLRRLDAPLLTVVGGSTGAGKSTLVNSLIRAPVSPAGVLRPTTRVPLLVCHPADAVWFGERQLLPGLARGPRPAERTLQIINAPALTPGLALLDAPDIDSVVDANRILSRELLAAGDLWLFVTTAVRYADAVPWRVLRDARERGTAVAVVLDRVPPEARDEIAVHFGRMLGGHGLGDAPLFVIAETTLDGFGLLPELDVLPIKKWIDGVARDGALRGTTARRTLSGAVGEVGSRVERLARAAEDQVRGASHLIGSVRSAFAAALSDVERDVRAGAELRGDVYSRWQELLDSGELRLALRITTGPRRSQVGAALAGRPAPGRRFQAAVAAGLARLITEVDVVATQRCRDEWQLRPDGRMLVAADPRLGRPWQGLADAAHDVVHDWQVWLRATAHAEAPRERTKTRYYATAATVLLATIATIAPPASHVTAAGSGSDTLRVVLDNRAVADLAEGARGELFVRVAALLSAEVDRHVAAVVKAGVDSGAAQRLRDAAAQLGVARSTAALVDAA